MKIDLSKFLNEEQQNEIYLIIKDLKNRVRKKEITNTEAFSEIKHGKRFREWINSIDDIDGFYGAFIPSLHKRLLKGYKSIFQKLVDEGVLIASNAGTQLGVVRDSSLINWDDDIDLVMDIKDFNKYKWYLKKKAIMNGWFPLCRNWVKNDFKTHRKKGNLWFQFFYWKRIKLDFGKVKSSFFPFMDVFPMIRIDENISKNEIEKVSLDLVRYYQYSNLKAADRIMVNNRIKNVAPDYYKKVSELKSENSSLEKARLDLSYELERIYKPNGNLFMQLNIHSPTFSLFDYSNRLSKEVEIFGDKYRFIVSDNFEEQFEMEYGNDWMTPKRSHSHFLLIWFAFLKR